jgi:hypothetical protein
MAMKKNKKGNLKEEKRPATQHDLELWGNQLALQMRGLENRVDGVEQQLERKIDQVEQRLEQKIGSKIDEAVQQITGHIDVAVENRKTDLLGVSSDEIKLMKDTVEGHEERLTTLEQKTGLR